MTYHIPFALVLAGTLVASVAPALDCNPHIRRSAPDDRYIVNAAQGTVLDKQTGLMWKRCLEGRSGVDCLGNAVGYDWYSAHREAAASTFAGYKDWRLPNRKELDSLVEVACYPPINNIVFPNISNSVWTSSYYYGDRDQAWSIDFNYSGHSGKSTRGYSRVNVRLVRDTQ